jgi:hypothetical protein
MTDSEHPTRRRRRLTDEEHAADKALQVANGHQHRWSRRSWKARRNFCICGEWEPLSEDESAPDSGLRRPRDELIDSERFQVEEARAVITRWEAERASDEAKHGIGYDREKVLVQHARNLLDTLDQIAPKDELADDH